MQREYSTLVADFESGKLFISDPEPAYPKSCSGEDLISRLNLLAESGWQAKSLSVNGTAFTISLERIDANPPEIPQYSLLMFQTSQQKSERPPISYEKHPFHASVQLWVTQGWREIKTAHLLTAHQGQWMLSLLVKEWAQSKHPHWRND